ncbi:PREDICTED: cytochrome P450 2D6-like [Branchiostoma belcheri]|uniref:Cytochrome P450 2D6-like n=1 Tax=Branchiostoma belcheri TaxID=7741 RepID=A0A6P4XDW7_BRABE|nr:PREDICTED: cytochrome P450 2D6-like [Branchiostoma belcheri]
MASPKLQTSPTRLFVGDTTYGLALVLVVLLVFMNKKSRRALRFPPGPPAWPLVGHLPLLGGRPHVRFAEWSRRYGPVLGVRLGPQQVVVLNGYAAVREALVTKAEVFSSRPDLYLMRLFSNGKGIGLAPYSAKWRAQRRVTDRALRNLGVGKLSFEPKIMEEVEEFISAAARYEGAAFDPKYHIAVGILNIICHLVFGRRFEHDDPLFVRLYNALEDISHHGGSAQHLNVFPALRHVPGLNAGAVHTVRAVREGRDFVREMIGQHKATFDPENIRDYIDAYLHQLQKETEDGEKKSATYLSDEELEQNVFDLFIAGSESTATTLRWATLLLLVNPEVQERVQQELDAVLGQGQASVLDRTSLPYTQATIQEILRYRPSATFSLPHATTADTTLQGYDIPAGTQVLVNVYGMGMDPALWQHPGTFDPTRFLDGEGKLSVPEHFKPFLVGRRACIGSQLAKMQLLLYITTVLQRFSLRLPEGEPPPSLDGSLGVMLQCPSFRMCAVPRAVTSSC